MPNPETQSTAEPIRLLALIYPIERHVGHWANSSPSIDVVRIIMEGDDLPRRILDALSEFQPQAIAIIGKSVPEYLDLLDQLSDHAPQLRQLPRVYRCQNTALAHRVSGVFSASDKPRLASLSPWFARASDERFSLVLVQTLDDVEIIRQALTPVRVIACPYGYDVTVFDPSLPELERTIDVGCYFNLKDDPRRVRLAETAREICARRGWSFRFSAGRYWHEYAMQLRTTKICLHQSEFQEIPYRMYETMALGSLFLSDPLRYSVERFFDLGSDYLTFEPDLGNLEHVLEGILTNPERWNSIRTRAKQRAGKHTWADVAEEYVAPALRELVSSRGSNSTSNLL